MPSTTRPRDAHQPDQPKDRTGWSPPDDEQEDYSPGDDEDEESLDPSEVTDQPQQRSRTRKAQGRI